MRHPVPLLEIGTMAVSPLPEATDLDTTCMKEAVANSARSVSSFCFKWIPPYRVYAGGEQFWKVLKLEDSEWNSAREMLKEEGEETSKKPAKAKL